MFAYMEKYLLEICAGNMLGHKVMFPVNVVSCVQFCVHLYLITNEFGHKWSCVSFECWIRCE